MDVSEALKIEPDFEVGEEVSQEIKRIGATRGKQHAAKKKMNKPIDSNLRSARQTVTSDTGIISFAIFGDVLQAVRDDAPGSSDKEVQALAQAEWEERYFKLDLYDIGDKQMTAAEAIGLWMSQGFPWSDCKDYLYNELLPIRGTTEGRKEQPEAKHKEKQSIFDNL